MDHIIRWTMLGVTLILVSWVTRTTLAQNSSLFRMAKNDHTHQATQAVTIKAVWCLPGNIYNSNLSLTGLSGTLRSPKEGQGYPPNLLCNWLITVPKGNIVKLDIVKFKLHESSGCRDDYLQVFDGNSSLSQSKGKFCGYTYDLEHPVIPDQIRSSGRYMVVRFRSDDRTINAVDEEFKITFTAEEKSICPVSNSRVVLTASASYIQTLTSPNYPSKPGSHVNCNWLLEVDSGLPDGYIVKVTRSEFSVSCGDPLKYYDGNSSSSSLRGSYCGYYKHPEVIYSTGRYLFVNFRTSDFSLTSEGFSLRFSAVKKDKASGICNPSDGNNKVHSLSGSSGTIYSPDYPVPYPDDVKYVWTLSVPAGNVVKLTFETFQLELDISECKGAINKDYVLIRDGKAPESKELADYCGYYDRMGPLDVFSTGHYMTVTFQSVSDGKQRKSGFKARFEAVDPQSAISNELCFPGNVNNLNLKLTGSHGTLKSPLRNSVYPPDVTCDWLITVPEGKTVKLHFDNLYLQSGSRSDCSKDYVEVRDGIDRYSDTLGRFCHGRPANDIHSSGRYMRVRFSSDSETSLWDYDGFSASFVAEADPDKPTVYVPGAHSMEVCYPGNINNNNLKLTDSSGTIQSPKKPGYSTYPSDSSCDWLVTVPEEKIVKLSFDKFALEPSSGSGCSEDYVEVLDGQSSDSEIKGTYCGYTIPDDILSSGRYMRMRFRSGYGDSHHSGFRATYMAVAKPNDSSSVVIIVIVTIMAVLAVVLCVVCVVKRKKKPNRDAAVEMPMLTSTSRITRLGGAQHSPHSTGLREIQPSPRATRPGVVQPSPRPPRQPPSQPTPDLPPLPPVGYAPVPMNPEVPPPDYPYPSVSPPPYPGVEGAPQYPPPGQSYPWLQSNSSNPVEPPSTTAGPVEPSAPPESP